MAKLFSGDKFQSGNFVLSIREELSTNNDTLKNWVPGKKLFHLTISVRSVAPVGNRRLPPFVQTEKSHVADRVETFARFYNSHAENKCEDFVRSFQILIFAWLIPSHSLSASYLSNRLYLIIKKLYLYHSNLYLWIHNSLVIFGNRRMI